MKATIKQVRRWRDRCEKCGIHPRGGLMCELVKTERGMEWLCLSERIGNKEYRGCIGRYVG